MLPYDPYVALGLPASASVQDVKTAHRRLALRLHPDTNPGSPGALAQFREVSEAYELLLDPARRQQYDAQAQASAGRERFHISVRVTPSRRVIPPLEEPQVVYMLVDIAPDERVRQATTLSTAHLNLTLVLDRSKSMEGTRLENVKVAVHRIIDQLQPEDILSVVIFDDRAEVVLPAAPVTDPVRMKGRVSVQLRAEGSTQMYQGLRAGAAEVRKHLDARYVNHVLLLTDGKTYGDQDACMALARELASEGIGLSAMGLGHEWNDTFVDELVAESGGSTAFIRQADEVERFLNDHVRSLSNMFAERLRLSVATDPSVQLESAFKLTPSAQPLDVADSYMALGGMQAHRPVAVLLQLNVPPNPRVGEFLKIARLSVMSTILRNIPQENYNVVETTVEVVQDAAFEDPPNNILDALSRLTLYRMQERARELLERGNTAAATEVLERLNTRLLERGEGELAQQTRAEIQHIRNTQMLSAGGSKLLKYQTRHLVSDVTTDAPPEPPPGLATNELPQRPGPTGDPADRDADDVHPFDDTGDAS